MSGLSCYSSIQETLKNPPRGPLTQNAALTTVAVDHVNQMVIQNSMSGQFPGQATLQSRLMAAGYTPFSVTGVYGYGGSAFSVVSAIICPYGTTTSYLFACSFKDVGYHAGGQFYTLAL
ncbi:hypothetical protein GPECTOR_5g241 [Gonium pectorale]|uniref:SCP domain-containing protein n=1 Tax=Gonium pectorale TaxID=33097 RepID=A0A150GWQ5_GONPE|nr:hypothetical protein GPECTOR_5g241 [Gonium pectorale]|eukprot:KXZ54142.1 hypothetical protein GPECTOR_5g241 [Gonium pectorale]